jgi:hypothetical protein
MRFLLVLTLSLGLFACGDDGRRVTRDTPVSDMGTVDPGDRDFGPPRSGNSTIYGQVWAPGNAPGMVPAGHEIPIYDALVRLTVERVPAIPSGVYCESCQDVGGWYGRTDHDGNFRIDNVVGGTYWLTVEKGQFRLERMIEIAEFEELALPQESTTLPSVHDPDSGDWVPRIAVATGIHDSLEDVLGKMGIGGVDGSGTYAVGDGTDQIDFYDNGGADISGHMEGTLADLVNDLGRMMQYHVIFIPCASSGHTSELQDSAVLNNIRDYVEMGGKLYVTDWSGEWMDNVFPAFIELGAGEDTPAEAYDLESNTWDTSLFGDADGSLYSSPDGEAANEDLNAWLHGQQGPLAEGGTGTYDANYFDVVDSWNVVENLPRTLIGYDDEGLPVYDDPEAWVIGSVGGSGPKKPLTVTFEPGGCGRVLYSTYHTTGTPHDGLVPQERVLLYLIMEIGVCKTGPILI